MTREVEMQPMGADKKAGAGAAPTETDDSKYRQLKANDSDFNAAQKFAGNEIRTTKYTLLTFLPKNLFEQFSRAANLYFLFIAVLQFIPGISPVSWWSSVLPLTFVLAVTAVKEAVEDYRRAQMDKQVNARSVQVLRGSELETIEWRALCVGDIVMVRRGQQFPADLVFLSSSDPSAICYIETMNLDGETNLKVKEALEPTSKIRTPAEFEKVRATVVCEKPNNSLYTFDGKIMLGETAGGKVLSVNVRNILLRGCMLRNTEWICGLAIFTGHDTKLMQNSNEAPTKRSQVERKMNIMIFILFGILALFCIGCAIGSGIYVDTLIPDHWYLTGYMAAAPGSALAALTFLVLYNIMIPISLYVSMEMVKVFHALLINLDVRMYHEETDTPAKARTSNLGEELGQISYIFSDKTGTLTCNVMEYVKCSIAGTSYGLQNFAESQSTGKKQFNFEKGFNFFDQRISNVAYYSQPNATVIREFLCLLAVCHTVIPEGDPANMNKMVYQAASPDEAALVAAAKNLGWYFHTRTPHSIVVREVTSPTTSVDHEFKILNILEFDSTRKRMSVIVRCPDGRIKLYCKGADTVIYERLSPQSAFRLETTRDLELFADEGLRTLCLAYAELDPAMYADWNNGYYQASIAMEGREEKINVCAEQIERNLFLLGATAIEDKLQNGVPDAIHNLARAGIKIWVLTGDKQETAINIGFSCKLLTTDMDLFIVNEASTAATANVLKSFRGQQGLIIDGKTLGFVLEDADLKMMFLSICTQCKAVICCRVSPLQKSLVVKLVKDNVKGTVTLAIGDGANDVPMIQAAHVGIGISGQEGMQAVMASDYAIAQFRFLQNLLLVHGRWNFTRLAGLINYSFYKNMAFALTQFWYACFSMFSGGTLHDSWHITFYNVIFTSLPIMFLAVLDQDVPASVALANPEIYETSQKGFAFGLSTFFLWLADGVYQSAALFFIPALAFGMGTGSAHTHADGKDMDGVWMIGMICFTCLVMTVNLKLILQSQYITAWNKGIIVATLLSWWVFEWIFCALPVGFMESLKAVHMIVCYVYLRVIFLSHSAFLMLIIVFWL
jgi:phospholipid-transporting ATPase